ncbi:MAG: hypothetical protein GX774_12695 [Armatimonadetes bacterium]|nr:hypothetical protein [Armatimonadota bacterium]
MSRFLFYYGKDSGAAARARRAAAAQWGRTVEVAAGDLLLWAPAAEAPWSVCETPHAAGAVTGYVRRDHLGHAPLPGRTPDWHHNAAFLEEAVVAGGWPLGSEWTGSFAAVGCAKSTNALVLCHDLTAMRPIYYATAPGGGIVGGTHLIPLSHCLRTSADAVGVLERAVFPLRQHGRRTLLRGVSRLLPGEQLTFRAPDAPGESAFDNSLCDGLLACDVDTAARIVWNCLQREIALATAGYERLHLGLSGGWDSRVILAGLAHRGGSVHCYTYGSANLYEAKVARRCAAAVGAPHECHGIEGRYFPTAERLTALVRETESAVCLTWNAILEGATLPDERQEVLLMGDMCENIDGRHMTSLASRSARIEAFLGSLLGRKEEYAPVTPKAFAAWTEQQRATTLAELQRHLPRLSPALARTCSEAALDEAVAEDLAANFARVHGNLPAFVCMLDELLVNLFWEGDQPRLMDAAFRTLIPPMSLRTLRLMTTIHPRLRVRRRLMDAIARLPEFDRLARIPSAQIPWFSARTPALLREVTWGLRSRIDQALIRRRMRTGNPHCRHRVVPSLDFVPEYRHPETAQRVQQWFSGRWITGDYYVELARKRGNLESWPLVNTDIAAAANVSLILDQCAVEAPDEGPTRPLAVPTGMGERASEPTVPAGAGP